MSCIRTTTIDPFFWLGCVNTPCLASPLTQERKDIPARYEPFFGVNSCFYGVVVSTPDFECEEGSGIPGSNPGRNTSAREVRKQHAAQRNQRGLHRDERSAPNNSRFQRGAFFLYGSFLTTGTYSSCAFSKSNVPFLHGSF